MTFVRIETNSEAAWTELRFDPGFRFPQTMLQTADGGQILLLPDLALDEMDEKGIGYEVIPERDVRDELSPKALAYLEHLEKHHPELVRFDGPLPPLHHIELFFRAPEHSVEAAKKILEDHGASEIRSGGAAGIIINVATDETLEEALDLVTVKCIIPRSGARETVDALMESGLTGFSRETAIYLGSDPDGAG